MNTAPEWTPGMDRITGMAAHPSMQRKTTEELWAGLARIDHDITASRGMKAFGSADWLLYVDGLREQRRAYVQALEWRGV